MATPHNLKKLQQQFFKGLRNRTTPREIFLNSRHFEVYSNSFYSTPRRILAMDFERVEKTLGSLQFKQLATDFQRTHPSTVWSLAIIGTRFPGFLAKHPLKKSFPYLSDLAQYEWAYTLAKLAPENVIQVANPGKTIRSIQLRHTLQLLDLNWDVRKATPTRKKLRLAVFKQFSSITNRELTALEFKCLLQLRKKQSISRFIAHLPKAVKPIDLERWMHQWSSSGWLAFEFKE